MYIPKRKKKAPPHTIYSSNCYREMREVQFDRELCLLSKCDYNSSNSGHLHIKKCTNLVISNSNIRF